jgi:hypothetical protein
MSPDLNDVELSLISHSFKVAVTVVPLDPAGVEQALTRLPIAMSTSALRIVAVILLLLDLRRVVWQDYATAPGAAAGT